MAKDDRPKKDQPVNPAVAITAIICGTVIVIVLIATVIELITTR
jgi:hypothetical protein